MTLEKQIKLAKANGTYDKLYGEIVNKKVRGSYNESEEIALLRKEIAMLKKEIAELKGISVQQTEFDVYNEYVEEQKENIKKVLGEYVR